MSPPPRHHDSPENGNLSVLPAKVQGYWYVWRNGGLAAIVTAYVCGYSYLVLLPESKARIASQERIAEAQAEFLKVAADTTREQLELSKKVSKTEEDQKTLLEQITTWQNKWKEEIEIEHKARAKEAQAVLIQLDGQQKVHQQQMELMTSLIERINKKPVATPGSGGE